jgi:hypothetical protein
MSSCGCRPPAAGHHLSVVRSGPSRSPTEALRSVLLLGVGHRRRSRGERLAGEHLLRDPELPSSPNRDRVAPTGGPGCRGRLVLTATGDLLRLVRERGCREEHHRPPVRVRDLMAAPPRWDHCHKSPEAPGLTRTGRVPGSRPCSFRAVATVTEIRDPVVDDHSLTISSPCPSVLSAMGRERTSAHQAPIRLVPERQLACRARTPARATLPGRGAPRVQLLGHPRPGQPPPSPMTRCRTWSGTVRLRPILLHVSLPELTDPRVRSGRSEREPPTPSWSPRSRSRWAAPACQHARFGPLEQRILG